MKPTTMNETTTENMQELNANDLTKVAGGDGGLTLGVVIGVVTSFVASALYDGYKSYNGPHLGPF